MRKLLASVLLVCAVGVMAQSDDKPFQPNLEGDLMLDYGFSFWNIKLPDLPVKPFGSNSVGLYYNRRLEINDHFAFHPAIGFTFDKFAFTGNHTWKLSDNLSDGVQLDTLGLLLSKNKLMATYLEIPIEFRYHPLGTVDGEGWFIGVGGMFGLRTGAHTKIKYDLDRETYKEKFYDDFGLKSYHYGVQFRFGFKNVHFFYKIYLSDLFNSQPDAGRSDSKIPRAATIGINVSGF